LLVIYRQTHPHRVAVEVRRHVDQALPGKYGTAPGRSARPTDLLCGQVEISRMCGFFS
jgi:hypothetical protein